MTVTPEMVAIAAGRPVPPLGSETRQQWEMWVGDALMLIRNRLDLATLDADVVDYVVREAVKAVVLRPDDATQVEVAIDDGRVSKRYESSTGRVTILDAWWDLLAPESAATTSAFSTRPGFQPDLRGWPVA